MRVPLRVGRGGGQPPVKPHPAARRQRLHRRGADQRMRHGYPVPGLGHDAGQDRGVQGRGRIAKVAEDRERLVHPDPPRRRDHGQRLRGRRGQRAGEPVGQRARQRRDRRLGRARTCRHLQRPERIAARLPAHQPGLRRCDRRGQQVLDLPHVQRGEINHLGRGPGGQQLAPAVRGRRRAGGQRVGRRLAAGRHEEGQRPIGYAPERECQGIETCLIEPLNVVDRQQYRAARHAGAQRSQHREPHGAGGRRLLAGRPQQKRDLERLQRQAGDFRRHQRQHAGQQVGQPGKGQVGLAGRGLAPQEASVRARGHLDSRAPQRGLARARLARHGQHGGRGPGLDAYGEIVDPPPFGRAHEAAANGCHRPHLITARRAPRPGARRPRSRHGTRRPGARRPSHGPAPGGPVTARRPCQWTGSRMMTGICRVVFRS
jgi:hypothetical protein